MATDGTLDIIQSYKIRHVVSEQDRGMYDAMNRGIRLAAGDIVGILNSDDMFYDRTVVANVVSAFQSNSIDCCYGDLIYVDRATATHTTCRWISRPFQDGLFEKSWTPAHPHSIANVSYSKNMSITG
ncbi:MAG: glycosyltransferase [Deltaproteobacteria bacterium]|nr:glycosyltransferase [Deltaproteobacteria bacterium]